MNLNRFPRLAASAIALTAMWDAAVADIPLFSAAELGLNSSTPSEMDFARPFETPLPAKVKNTDGNRLMQLENCHDYLNLHDRIIGSDNEADYRVLLLQTTNCVALALLQSAKPAQQTALPKDFLLNTKTRDYPATLWPAISKDERQRLMKPKITLQDASKKTTFSKEDKKSLKLEASGMGLRLTTLVRGDFDHDGWEDAALRWESYASKGSYANARIVVLTRTAPKQGFQELSLDRLLSGH